MRFPEELDPFAFVRKAGGDLLRRYPGFAEEMFLEGLLGLVEALAKVDPEKNFKAYARIRIRGKMMDYVRREYKFYSNHVPLELVDVE